MKILRIGISDNEIKIRIILNLIIMICLFQLILTNKNNLLSIKQSQNNHPGTQYQMDDCNNKNTCYHCISSICSWKNNICSRDNLDDIGETFTKYNLCSKVIESNPLICGNFAYSPNYKSPELISYMISKKQNGNYFDQDLYCKISVNLANMQDIYFQILNYVGNKIKITVELVRKSDQTTRQNIFYYEVTDKYLEKIDTGLNSINIYFLSSTEFNVLPFDMQIVPKTNNNSPSAWTWLYITSSIIVFFCSFLGLCCRLCRRAHAQPTVIIELRRRRTFNNPNLNLEFNDNESPELIRKNTVIYNNYYQNELKSSPYLKETNQYNEECVICLDQFINGQSEVIKLPCQHFFHEICIKDWIVTNITNAKCPCCNDLILTHLEKIKENKDNVINEIENSGDRINREVNSNLNPVINNNV